MAVSTDLKKYLKVPHMTITIPPEALEAMKQSFRDSNGPTYDDDLRAAALALLENWPGMMPAMREKGSSSGWYTIVGTACEAIILPLPTEAGNDKA